MGTELVSIEGLQSIEMQAKVLATSGIVPKDYRGNHGAIIAAALVGYELGWSPMVSLQYIDVVEGKPRIKTEGLVGLVRSRGHNIRREVLTDDAGNFRGIRAVGKRNDNGDQDAVEWTLADSERAGLSGKNNHAKYPADMCWARAAGALCRVLFPDIGMGMTHSADELEEAAQEEAKAEVLQHPATPPAVAAQLPAAATSSDDIDRLTRDLVNVMVLLGKPDGEAWDRKDALASVQQLVRDQDDPVAWLEKQTERARTKLNERAARREGSADATLPGGAAGSGTTPNAGGPGEGSAATAPTTTTNGSDSDTSPAVAPNVEEVPCPKCDGAGHDGEGVACDECDGRGVDDSEPIPLEQTTLLEPVDMPAQYARDDVA